MNRPTGAYIDRDPDTGKVREIALVIQPDDLVPADADEKKAAPGCDERGAEVYVIRGAENRKHT